MQEIFFNFERANLWVFFSDGDREIRESEF